MYAVSYNLTPSLKAKLASIDELAKDTLVMPVSVQIETQLRLNAVIAHLDGWARLTNQPVTREQLVDIVGHFHARNATPQISKLLSYKSALNYIREHWTANRALVNFGVIKDLSSILRVTSGSSEAIDPLLTYLQSSSIHPVIQAALVHLAFYPSRSAYLLSLLFLAKGGYDLRGWLSLEDCWAKNKEDFLQVLQQANSSQDPTLWLEYFCEAVMVQMASIKAGIEKLSSTPAEPYTISINDRQKAILDLVAQSPEPMTNRQVQEAFKVSQITASRDLARLSLAGLLASHGSGRSTHYTKV